MGTGSGQLTHLLKALRAGDPQAAQDLLPLVYAELHRLAKSYMRRERPDHTLQATALINETYPGEDLAVGSAATGRKTPQSGEITIQGGRFHSFGWRCALVSEGGYGNAFHKEKPPCAPSQKFPQA